MRWAVGILVALGLGVSAPAMASDLPPVDPPVDSLSDPVGQMVFFAVLEGCYRDGLSTSDVDAILPKDADTGGVKLEENFIYGCPLCMPVVEALRLYQGRNRFFGDERGRSAFGKGLDPDHAKRLHSESREVRIDAITQLISRWVTQRMQLEHLTDQERNAWALAIDHRRKRGEELLKSLKSGERGADYVEQYRTWSTHCPVCDAVSAGAAAAH